ISPRASRRSLCHSSGRLKHYNILAGKQYPRRRFFSVRISFVARVRRNSARKFASRSVSNAHHIHRTKFAFHPHHSRIQQTSLARRNGALRSLIHHHSPAHSRRVCKPPPLAPHSGRRSKHCSHAFSREHSFQRPWIRPIRDQRHASAIHRNRIRFHPTHHQCRQAIVVAERRLPASIDAFQLRRRYRVILIHHRQHSESQQLLHRAPQI